MPRHRRPSPDFSTHKKGAMSFAEIIESYRDYPVLELCAAADTSRVEQVLNKQRLSIEDLPVLLSDAALNYLEPIAAKAAALTRKHFGNAVVVFTPLYISNYCTNRCTYCSFAHNLAINRQQLDADAVKRECRTIAGSGIRHILVLTGEAPQIATFDYIRQSLRIIADHFSSVAIEMYPMSEDEYRELIALGSIDSLTIYQETYNQKLYADYHQSGPKMDYFYRLETPDRACTQNIRAVTIGALLGLDDFRREALHLALHARYLQKTYPGVEVGLSFPRICPLVDNFKPLFTVSDRQLVQIVTAFRLLFPTLGITMTTREHAHIRDGILPLGVTKVSAGVSTAVGGHSDMPSTTQFDIADHRSVDEMKRDLLALGFQPVMHDWNLKMSRVCTI